MICMLCVDELAEVGTNGGIECSAFQTWRWNRRYRNLTRVLFNSFLFQNEKIEA